MSLLHYAIRRKRLPDIRRYVAMPALINQPDENGETPMHILSKTGGLPAYTILIEQGASVNLRDQSGYLPLHCAAEAGHLNLIEELINVTDDVNCQTAEGDTALLLACQNNRDECVKFLPGRQAKCCMTNANGNFALKECLAGGNTPMAKLLIENFNDKNHQFPGHRTPLFLPCEYADFECARLLLGRRADISIANEAQEIPLHMACSHGMDDIVGRLIGSGDLVNASTVDGQGPIHYAAEAGQVDIIKLLINNNADVNIATRGCKQAIHIAVEHDYVDILEVLADSGADINSKTGEGLTPLHIASERDHSDCFDFLLQSKADVKATTEKGWTALHSACHGGSLRAANMLIQRGGHLDARANDDSTPLQLACEQGNASCALMLLNEKADAFLATNKDQNALHAAVKGGHFNIINRVLELAVEKAVDIDAITVGGQTITELASHSHIRCLQLLRSKGATINRPDTVALVQHGKGEDQPTSHHLAVDSVYDCEPEALCMALWDNPDCRQHLYFQKFATRSREEVMSSILMSLRGDPQTGQNMCMSGCDDFAGPIPQQQHQAVDGQMDWNAEPTDFRQQQLQGGGGTMDLNAEPTDFMPRYSAPGSLTHKQKTTQQLQPYQRLVHNNLQNLAESMDPDRVMDILYNNGLFPHETFQNYKRNSPGPISTSKTLLRHIAAQSKEVFRLVIETLRKGGQEQLVKLMTGQLECCRPPHRDLLQKCYGMLKENLDDIPKLCNGLLAKSVISMEEYESFKYNKRPEQVYSLIDIMKRKTTKEYNVFLEVLDSSKQKHVADELRHAMHGCGDNLAINPN